MDWIVIAFLVPILWAVSNFIDKFLISKYFKGGSGTLVVYSCLIGFPVSFFILIFRPEVLNLSFGMILLILFNGFLGVLYLFPYFKALSKADASLVIPIFQVIPIISYFLAFFVLGEILSKFQLLASALIISGAVGISLRFDGKRMKFRSDVILLMLLSSFIISVDTLLFKFFAINLDFWIVSFWQYLGLFISGLVILIISRKYRNEFLLSFKQNGKKIVSLNIFNESINMFAILILSYASLLAPLSLVWVINGFQPLFVFLFGLVLTLFAPYILKENVEKRVIIQKVFFIILMLTGAYLLGF